MWLSADCCAIHGICSNQDNKTHTSRNFSMCSRSYLLISLENLFEQVTCVFQQHLISIGLGRTSATAEVSDGPVPFLSSVEATKDLPILPLPIILPQQTRVLVSGVAGYDEQLVLDDDTDVSHYPLRTEVQKAEEGLVTKAGFLTFFLDRLDAGCSLSMNEWRKLEQYAFNGHDGSYPSAEFVSCLQNCYDENTENSTEPVCVVGGIYLLVPC